MDALAALLEKTAWLMETPKPYGAFHMLFFCLGVSIAVSLAYRLRRLNAAKARALLLSVGIGLALAEIYKQLFYYYIVMDGVYNWWIFPFQLCSMPMYVCIAAPLLPRGGAQNTLYEFLLGFGVMAGFAAFLQPDGMLYPYITLTLHSCLWHVAQIFIGCFLGFSGRAGRSMRGFMGSVLLYLMLCGVAYCMNLALWDVSGGQINMFYIGPMPTTTMVFEKIEAACGQFAAALVYMAASCLGAFLVFMPFYLCNRKKRGPGKHSSPYA